MNLYALNDLNNGVESRAYTTELFHVCDEDFDILFLHSASCTEAGFKALKESVQGDDLVIKVITAL